MKITISSVLYVTYKNVSCRNLHTCSSQKLKGDRELNGASNIFVHGRACQSAEVTVQSLLCYYKQCPITAVLNWTERAYEHNIAFGKLNLVAFLH